MIRKIEMQIDTNRCKGCGLCVSTCPQRILQLSGNLSPKGYHYPEFLSQEKCTGCRFCAVMCPEIAIRIEAVDVRP